MIIKDSLNDSLNGYIYIYKEMGNIYFTSKELAEQAIEEIGESNIKKYLFGINDEEDE